MLCRGIIAVVVEPVQLEAPLLRTDINPAAVIQIIQAISREPWAQQVMTIVLFVDLIQNKVAVSC